MVTHRGHFKQVDGVKMGSSVGPLLPNSFASKYDSDLGSVSKFSFPHVDDVLKAIRLVGEACLEDFVNFMH